MKTANRTTPAPKPSVPKQAPRPAPTRPPSRTPPPRYQPKGPQKQPNNITVPDAVGVARRGFVRTLGGAIAAILDPSPVNEGEDEFLSNPRYNNSREFEKPPKGIEHIEERRDGGARVVVNNKRELWSPPRYRNPEPIGQGKGGLGGTDVPPQAEGVPGQRPGGTIGSSLRQKPQNPWDEEVGYGYEEEAYDAHPDPFRDPILDREEAPAYEPGFIKLPGRNPLPVPVPVGDPLPVAPPSPRVPPAEWVRPGRGIYHPGLVVSVGETADGPQITFRPKLYREANLSRPRYRDNKYGRQLVGVLNYIVTATYGVVSEAEDAAEVFAWSLYGVEQGRVVPAMLLSDMSMAEAFRGYLEGDYRLDAAGFAFDYAINQVEDYAYAAASRAQLAAMQKALGDNLGYKLNRYTVRDAQYEGANYVQPWISRAEKWVSSFDRQRSDRIRALF